MGKSFYNMNGEKLECKVESELSLSQKTGFIMEVAGMVVSPTVGYGIKKTICAEDGNNIKST